MGFRSTLAHALSALALALAFAPATAARAGCLTDLQARIPGLHIISYSGTTWAEVGLGQAEKDCKACDGAANDKARADCMAKKLDDAHASYEKELTTFLASAAKSGVPATVSVPDAFKACPGADWKAMTAATSQGYGPWTHSRDCLIKKACGGNPGCEEDLSRHALNIEIPAVRGFQGMATVEALRTGASAPEVLNFEDDVVEGAMKPKKKRYASSASAAKGVTPQSFLAISEESDERTGEQDKAFAAATHDRMGCPDQAAYTIPSGGKCLRGLEPGTNKLYKTMDDLKPVLSKYVYEDLARHAVEQVWQSYTVALLSDPNVTGGGCTSEGEALQDIERRIGTDGYLGHAGSPEETLSKLGSCFGKLGAGKRVEDLARTARNVRCGTKDDGVPPAAGACKGDEDSDKSGSEAHARRSAAFARRVKDLDLLRTRMKELKDGKFKVGGKPVTCPGGSWGGDCARFFEKMESCAPDYLPVNGCMPPDDLQEDLALAWHSYSNLKSTQNYVLSKYPELAAQVATIDSSKSIVYKPAWEVAFERGKNAKLMEEYYDTATQESRRGKLGFILGEACKDPEEFAKKMLMTNPELINSFLDQAKGPDMGTLLCIGLSEAQKDERRRQWVKTGAQALTMALAMAAAIPSGGASIALAVASTAGAVGMTAYDIQQAYSRARLEAGLHQSCLGDYSKARAAEDALDDAIIRAAIDTGVGVGMFAGMAVVEKIATLKRLANTAEGIEGAAPAWSHAVAEADHAYKGLKSAERAAISEEYGLADIPGMTKSGGGLTAEGRKTAELISDLEGMGMDKDALRGLLKECTLK